MLIDLVLLEVPNLRDMMKLWFAERQQARRRCFTSRMRLKHRTLPTVVRHIQALSFESGCLPISFGPLHLLCVLRRILALDQEVSKD